MRADRLLSLLMLLQSRGRMTAGELAEALEVSERTIYRDIDALSIAGVPVYGLPGRGGGFALVDRYRTSLTGMTTDEIRALFMLSIPAPLDALGMSQELRGALRKLAASLPAGHREAEREVRQRFHFDATAWQQGETAVPHLQAVHRAVREDRVLVLRYEPFPGLEVEQAVAPYGLVAKAGLWYAITRHIEDLADPGEGFGPLHARRVDRLIEARLTETVFTRPANFDLADFWAQWREARQALRHEYRVAVLAAPEILRWIEPHVVPAYRDRVQEAKRTESPDMVRLALAFESLEDARARLLAFGGAVEVLSPLALRCSVADYAQQILKRYA